MHPEPVADAGQEPQSCAKTSRDNEFSKRVLPKEHTRGQTHMSVWRKEWASGDPGASKRFDGSSVPMGNG